METKKQEAIRKAYGDQWDSVKDFVCDYSGWCSDQQYYSIDCPKPTSRENVVDEYVYKDNAERKVEVYQWIPKSIFGIEDNNGWIVAYNNELPIEGIYKVGKFLDNGSFHIGHDDVEWFDLREYVYRFDFTHYQPIIKPLPPVY